MKEVKLLGIDKKKGWMKRFKDLEIDGAMLHRLTSVVVSNRRAPQAAKTKLMEVQKHYVVDDIQMLYLMRSFVCHPLRLDYLCRLTDLMRNKWLLC